MTKVLIVTARYYQSISAALEAGAAAYLTQANASFEFIELPGALEIPAAISMAAHTGMYDAYVALGCVIRGETSHYDIVAQESAKGLNQLAITDRLAIGNGILTVENEQQAIARADIAQGNKGGFAAHAALNMLALKRRWEA